MYDNTYKYYLNMTTINDRDGYLRFCQSNRQDFGRQFTQCKYSLKKDFSVHPGLWMFNDGFSKSFCGSHRHASSKFRAEYSMERT